MRFESRDDEEGVFLTMKEFAQLQPKGTKLKFMGEPVTIKVPFDEKTCNNWDSWLPDNTGIIYKGVQVSVAQLQFLSRLIQRNKTDRQLSPLCKFSVKFDGKDPSIIEVNMMIQHVIRYWEPIKRDQTPVSVEYIQ